MKTQTKYPVTSMARLRKEKKRLEAQIEQEKVELFAEVDRYKKSLWPFQVMHKFRKTADSLAENKFVVLGAQLAQAAFNTAKEKSGEEKTEGGKGKFVDFLKSMAANFLETYTKHENKEE